MHRDKYSASKILIEFSHLFKQVSSFEERCHFCSSHSKGFFSRINQINSPVAHIQPWKYIIASRARISAPSRTNPRMCFCVKHQTLQLTNLPSSVFIKIRLVAAVGKNQLFMYAPSFSFPAGNLRRKGEGESRHKAALVSWGCAISFHKAESGVIACINPPNQSPLQRKACRGTAAAALMQKHKVLCILALVVHKSCFFLLAAVKECEEINFSKERAQKL